MREFLQYVRNTTTINPSNPQEKHGYFNHDGKQFRLFDPQNEGHFVYIEQIDERRALYKWLENTISAQIAYEWVFELRINHELQIHCIQQNKKQFLVLT